MNRCTNDGCSQHRRLKQTGFGEKQGCTHYCIICGWGYWTHIIKPTAEQIQEAQKLYPKLKSGEVSAGLTREVLKPVPEGELGKGAEKVMIEHLGGFQPFWLNEELKKVWREKYYILFPDKRPKDKEE